MKVQIKRICTNRNNIPKIFSNTHSVLEQQVMNIYRWHGGNSPWTVCTGELRNSPIETLKFQQITLARPILLQLVL
jgi:hypothetical protein